MMRSRVIGLTLALVLPTMARAQAPLAAQGCLGCHGPGGGGMAPVPGIAGRPAAEIVAVLAEFRADTRPGTIMGRIARGYSDAESAALAAYFAALPKGTTP